MERRARREPCRFSLLIPDVRDRRKADWTLDGALPLLRRAAHGPVDGLVGGPDPFTAIVVVVVRGRTMGMIVDRVSEVMGIPTSDVQPPPEGSSRGGLLSGMGKVGDKLVILLDVEAVLLDDECGSRGDEFALAA